MRRRIPTIRRTGACSVPNGNPGLFLGRRPTLHSYAAYCRRHFGGRVRKIAVDAGLSCPNRDGTIGSEGCTFCDNRAFTPSYCSPRKSLARQIDEGIAFHAARGRDEGLCLAYFQPFSNTHAPVTRLRELYAEALDHPRISGLVIGTRPDCVDDEKLDLLAELARKHYVAVEYGVESTCDETLRAVRRGHDFAAARQAIAASAARGLHVGAHFILGCPRRRRNASSAGGADQCPAARNGQVPPVAARSGNGPCRPIRRRARPLPPAYLRGVSPRWWSRCCGGCVPIWLWSVSPAKCRWGFTT